MDQLQAQFTGAPARRLVYDADEIDALLNQLHSANQQLRTERDAALARAEEVEQSARLTADAEAMLGRVLVRALRAADQTMAEANERATAVIAGANAEARALIEAAEQQHGGLLRHALAASTRTSPQVGLAAAAPPHSERPKPLNGVLATRPGWPAPTSFASPATNTAADPETAARATALLEPDDDFFKPTLRWTKDGAEGDRFFADLRAALQDPPTSAPFAGLGPAEPEAPGQDTPAMAPEVVPVAPTATPARRRRSAARAARGAHALAGPTLTRRVGVLLGFTRL